MCLVISSRMTVVRTISCKIIPSLVKLRSLVPRYTTICEVILSLVQLRSFCLVIPSLVKLYKHWRNYDHLLVPRYTGLVKFYPHLFLTKRGVQEFVNVLMRYAQQSPYFVTVVSGPLLSACH